MSRQVRLIQGKGDWEAQPPTGASDADLYQLANDFIIQGGVADLAGGDSLVVENDTPGFGVTVPKGTLYVPNSSWLPNSNEPRFYQVVADTDEVINVATNSSGSTRVDLVCQKIDKITAPNDEGDNVGPLVIVQGTPGSGAPAVPSNHLLLATLTLPDGYAAVVNAMIEDERIQVKVNPAFLPDDFLRDDDVQTISNKRITKRVVSIVSDSAPTPDADITDQYQITALAASAVFGAPTGTPTNGQGLLIRIKDNATSRGLTFNAIYRFPSDIPAPAATIISKTMYLGFIYNSTDSKWDCVAYIDGY